MIVFSDLDGTFLTNDKRVSSRNLEALDALDAAGVPFVPCSGRALSGILPEILEHPAARYAVTSNGAAVTNLRSKEVIYRVDLGVERALRYYEVAHDYDVTFDIFADGRIYTHRCWFDRLDEYIQDPAVLASVRRSRTPYDEKTPAFLSTLEHIERIAMYWYDPADRDAIKARIAHDVDVSIVRSVPNDIEISDARATKGIAMAWLCEKLGIALEDVVAFGDNINDISMLEAAGTGVAMENAEPETKAAADAVTGTNDASGVGEYLLQLFAAQR